MYTVNIKEARARFRKLLDTVLLGEEIIICRRDKPVAKLVPIPSGPAFPDRSEFRKRIAKGKTPSGEIIRKLRDEKD